MRPAPPAAAAATTATSSHRRKLRLAPSARVCCASARRAVTPRTCSATSTARSTTPRRTASARKCRASVTPARSRPSKSRILSRSCWTLPRRSINSALIQDAITSLASSLLPAPRWIRNRGRGRQCGEWRESMAPRSGGVRGHAVVEVGADLPRARDRAEYPSTARRAVERLLVGRGYAPDLARAMSEYVPSSKDQNQPFFEDHEKLFKGYHVPEIAQRYNAEITPALLDELKARVPGKTHFFYDGIATLLRKR